MDILWLCEDEVKSVLKMEDAIKAVEIAFRDHGLGKTQMPPKPYIYFSRYGGDLRTMPAYLEGPDLAGVKIVNVHAGNLAHGLPTVMAILVLNSPQTGAPLAIMGATYLTAMRTGAAGALAAKLLARPESKVVGIVGAGVQGRTQLLGISKFFRIGRVIVSDISQDRVMAFEVDISKFLDCEFAHTTNPMEACDCDILVTTTPSRSPVIKEAWIKPGTHVNAIGADAKGKQELESSLTKNAKVVVDDITQAVHSGEVNVPISEGILRPEEIYAQIGDLVVGKKRGRESNEEITIFDSTGLAIQDISAGWMVYERALEMNIGERMKFL
ncbi:MAG: alanine dehydrogenase [Methanotrichaceae archaeon]|nr:alanine dehydrogenase [Methanotrichaceae archaeon]